MPSTTALARGCCPSGLAWCATYRCTPSPRRTAWMRFPHWLTRSPTLPCFRGHATGHAPLLGFERPDRPHARGLSGAAVPARARKGGAAARPRVRAERQRDRGGLRRGGRDRAQGRERARARLPAREARADRGLGRERRRDGRRGAHGGRRRRARPPPRGQGARAGPGGGARAGELLVFADANATLAPGSLRRLVERFGADPQLGYLCGQVRFTTPEGDNQEGVYWRYETAVRELESRVGDVTAGNGALYATRRESYVVVDPRMGHDLSFPFNMVKRGWRAKDEPAATAPGKKTPPHESGVPPQRPVVGH